MKSPQFTASAENESAIARLEELLSMISVGGTEPYQRLAVASGKDILRRDRHLLQRAIKRGEKSLGCVFVSVRNVGIKRMLAEESGNIGFAALKRGRRLYGRAADRIDNIRTNDISDTALKQNIALISQLRVLAAQSNGRELRHELRAERAAQTVKPIPSDEIVNFIRRAAK